MELEIYNAFQAAGVPDEKAKAAVEAINKTIDSRYAIHARELATRGDVEKVRADVEKFRGELKADIANTKAELIKWYVGGATAQILGIGYFILRVTGNS
jgi:demethoxyubiquinone hydroxylase (CLK1/Coq7/Cat5 family)